MTTSIDPAEMLSGESVRLSVVASDPEGHALTFNYTLDGQVLAGQTEEIEFTVPSEEGTHLIVVLAKDDLSQTDVDTLVISVCVSTSFGLYSEGEHCGLVLDQNSFLGLYSGGGADVSEFEDDPNEKVEGVVSKRMTINVAPTNEYAGWFIMYGVDGTPDSYARDMSVFDGGSLRFSIKSDVDDLLVSIRSGDVIAGKEHNVLLSSVPEFTTGEWVGISIPVVRFTDPPVGKPKADLTKIKILFNIASSQESEGTNGTQTFWVDNVRWVRPGY